MESGLTEGWPCPQSPRRPLSPACQPGHYGKALCALQVCQPYHLRMGPATAWLAGPALTALSVCVVACVSECMPGMG